MLPGGIHDRHCTSQLWYITLIRLPRQSIGWQTQKEVAKVKSSKDIDLAFNRDDVQVRRGLTCIANKMWQRVIEAPARHVQIKAPIVQVQTLSCLSVAIIGPFHHLLKQAPLAVIPYRFTFALAMSLVQASSATVSERIQTVRSLFPSTIISVDGRQERTHQRSCTTSGGKGRIVCGFQGRGGRAVNVGSPALVNAFTKVTDDPNC